MPTVRLTKKLIESINKSTKELLDKQRKELPELSIKEANKILNNFVEYFHLQPHKADFLNTSIHYIRLANLTNYFKIGIDSIMISVTPRKLCIPKPIAFADQTIHVFGDSIDYPLPKEDEQLIKINITQQDNILGQCIAFEEQLKDLLKRCTTVKQFIEAWPQGEQFIPSSDLQKHYEQEKKQRKRGVYLEDEELSNLNAVILTSKLI